MITTPNMSLTAWDSPGDYFNHTELAENFDLLDSHDHTSGNGVQIPVGGLANNSVATANVIDSAVTTGKVADGAITTAKFAPNVVTTATTAPFPAARVFNNAAISIANNTPVNLTYNSETFDTASLHSTGVNPERLTAPIEGVYVATTHVRFAASATGVRYVAIINTTGAALAESQINPASAGSTLMTVSTIVYLAAGEYLRTQVFQDSGGALNVSRSASNSPEFTMAWLSKG